MQFLALNGLFLSVVSFISGLWKCRNLEGNCQNNEASQQRQNWDGGLKDNVENRTCRFINGGFLEIMFNYLKIGFIKLIL